MIIELYPFFVNLFTFCYDFSGHQVVFIYIMQMQLISSGKFYSQCNISKINIRMTYKEKVKKELRTTLETFHTHNVQGKTQNIHKK